MIRTTYIVCPKCNKRVDRVIATKDGTYRCPNETNKVKCDHIFKCDGEFIEE